MHNISAYLKKARYKRHTVWFHLYRVQNKEKEPQVLEVGIVVPPEGLGWERVREGLLGVVCLVSWSELLSHRCGHFVTVYRVYTLSICRLSVFMTSFSQRLTFTLKHTKIMLQVFFIRVIRIAFEGLDWKELGSELRMLLLFFLLYHVSWLLNTKMRHPKWPVTVLFLRTWADHLFSWYRNMNKKKCDTFSKKYSTAQIAPGINTRASAKRAILKKASSHPQPNCYQRVELKGKTHEHCKTREQEVTKHG